MKIKLFGLTETKWFHFHGMFKKKWGFARTPWTPSESATEVHAQLSWARKKFYNIGACFISWVELAGLSLAYPYNSFSLEETN